MDTDDNSLLEENIMNEPMFEFGKNWKRFIRNYLNNNRKEKAIHSLQQFLEIENLKGKTFIDVGCGSGLFSLAAYELEAKHIISLDIDSFSVKCCEYLKNNIGNPPNWEIFKDSILDSQFVLFPSKFDIVYSWGVLHHTGDMWKAIYNASSLVKDGGLFYLAIYNKADGMAIYPDGRIGPSQLWKIIKKYYSGIPLTFQNLIDYSLMSILFLGYIFTLNNPVEKIKSYQENYRGMSWRIDIKDWLGGYPYEFASVAEIFKYMKKIGFHLENINNNNGLRNNEFLFRKTGTDTQI